jgi:hypothetical protein
VRASVNAQRSYRPEGLGEITGMALVFHHESSSEHDEPSAPTAMKNAFCDGSAQA